jgi:hypothetical protein
MAEDPLDTFRRLADTGRPPHAASLRPPVSANRMPYVPFDTKDDVRRLMLRAGRSGQAYGLLYPQLTLFGYNWLTHTQLVLTTPGLVAIIQGQRLAEIEDAVSLHACAFIQQYDAELFMEPDPARPLIEHIEFLSMLPEPAQASVPEPA